MMLIYYQKHSKIAREKKALCTTHGWEQQLENNHMAFAVWSGQNLGRLPSLLLTLSLTPR